MFRMVAFKSCWKSKNLVLNIKNKLQYSERVRMISSLTSIYILHLNFYAWKLYSLSSENIISKRFIAYNFSRYMTFSVEVSAWVVVVVVGLTTVVVVGVVWSSFSLSAFTALCLLSWLILTCSRKLYLFLNVFLQ